MATALTPSSPPSNRHWWPRISSNKVASAYGSEQHRYLGGIPTFGSRQHTPSGSTRPTLMTSVTNPKTTAPNVLTSSAKSTSRFNLASVIGFGSKSKKQQPVDIQDPPSQVRSLPTPRITPCRDYGVTPQASGSSNPRLSRGVASSTSGTSRTSTDGPLTPADDPAPGSRISYQHSLMTLTDLGDPFATNSPLSSDRRSSAHSDKSISRRLMHKIDSKSAKTIARLPVGDGQKGRESKDRSATLPSRVRVLSDASDMYQPLSAVGPPWATEPPRSVSPMSPRSVADEHLKTLRGQASGTTIRHSKPGIPWSDGRPNTSSGGSFVPSHDRAYSSSSISKELLPDISRSHIFRPSTSSSIPSSTTSSIFTSSFSLNSASSGPGSSLDVRQRSPSTSAQATPTTTTTQFPRMSPRPPPTTGLPPTPPQASGSPSLLHPPAPITEQHPLRARSGTAASASALSFASSLSSLSFNSRPSPQEPPPSGARDYSSLMDETFPLTGNVDAGERRGSNSGSSSNSLQDRKASSGGAKGSTTSPLGKSPRRDPALTPKPPKAVLSTSRPLPSPPGPPHPQAMQQPPKRERAPSAASSTFSVTSDNLRTLRKQRSLHNTSIHAPTPLQPALKRYASFDRSVPAGAGGQVCSPPLPPPHELPPPPPPPPLTPTANSGKRSSTGKELTTSPRRKLFGTHKHERKQEPENVDTNLPASASSGTTFQSLHNSSSWFDDSSAGSEPASASSASPSTAHDVAQHIVPPAELLRLGAAWGREEGQSGLRRAKSSWSSHDSSTTYASTSRVPIPRSAGNSSSSSPGGSKLPRSASLLSKATSAPSFGRPRDLSEFSFASANSSVSQEGHTSLSPPPRRAQRSIPRPFPHRTISNPTAPSGSTPPKGALIERKPSFLDMSTQQSVSLNVPELADRDEPERDSFLELSRGMDSIDTIRESIDSVDSFMQ